MRVRCPHCQNPIEMIDEDSLVDVLCDSCGSSFSLVCDETISSKPTIARTLGHFRLTDKLGMGAYGTVWKATDTELDRQVAIKIPRADDLSSKEVEQFLREARAAAQLKHPNIVGVHEVGKEDDSIYIVSDYVEGITLTDWLTGQRPTIRTAVELIQKIANALHAAHEAGVIHRDLKPSNIMLDMDNEPHIMDFGLAKREAGEITMTADGHVLGTPAYMSPEQAKGDAHHADRRSDVYSLGVILFELLTGERPFRGNARMLVHQVLREEAPSPRTLNSLVPKDLETITLKCLAKDPSKRYSSAASLSDDLDRFLRGAPILARPVGSAERLWRWCRRNPGMATLSATFFLLPMLVITTIGSTFAAFKINERRQEAVTARRDEEIARKLAEKNAIAAELSAKVADEQLRLAVDRYHSMFTKVVAKLRDRADLADLKKALLQEAFEGLQEVSRTAQNSGRADRTVGVAHQRMADILEQLGKTEDANSEHRKAIAIFETLFQADPEEDWAKWNAAISYDKLGDHLLSTDESAATEYYQKSLALRQELAKVRNAQDLAANQRQRALIISSAKLGRLALQKGRPADARVFFEEALQQSEAMLKTDPSNGQMKTAVAGSCSLLGRVSFSLGDLAATREYYGRALELRQAMHTEDPTSVSAATYLAGAFEALGDVELQTGQTRKAQAYYESAINVLDELFAKDTNNAAVKASLSTLYYKLATTLLRLDDPATAGPIYAQCLELREELLAADPNDPNKQISVILARARCGLHRQAATLADQLRAKADDNAGTLFYVACGYALCAGTVSTSENEEVRSLETTYVDSALEALGQAVKLGYHDVVALQTDPDLDSLRENEDFQRLLAEMEHTLKS